MASSFRLLNSSTGIPSDPLALLTAVLPQAPLDFALQNVWLWVADHTIIVSHFIWISLVHFFHTFFFLISSASTRYLPITSFIVPIFGQNAPLISWRDLWSIPFRYSLLVLYTVHWRRPSFLSMLCFGNLHLVGYTFPFLRCEALQGFKTWIHSQLKL